MSQFECPACGVFKDTEDLLAKHMMVEHLATSKHRSDFLGCVCGAWFFEAHHREFARHLELNGGAWFHWHQYTLGVTSNG